MTTTKFLLKLKKSIDEMSEDEYHSLIEATKIDSESFIALSQRKVEQWIENSRKGGE